MCLFPGQLSVIVGSCSHVWRFELWVQTSVGIAWLISPSICFLDSRAWSLDHAHMFASLHCDTSPSIWFLDIRAWSLDHVQTFASLDCESRPAMANCWLIPPYVSFLDIWVWCLVYAAMANSWLIPPSVWFLDIWVDHAHIFGGLDCESRPAMANSWLTPPSVCFLDILSVIVRSCSHSWRFGLWVQTSWLIPPYVCFLDIWVWSMVYADMV